VKLVVDSGEFSKRITAAKKYASKSASDITSSALLEVTEGGELTIRTTTFSSDLVATVNGFGDAWEPGIIATRADNLSLLARDTGEPVEISTKGTSLILDYGNNVSKIPTTNHTKDDFPILVSGKYLAEANIELLSLAAVHTRPIEETGHPIKSAVHLIPLEEGYAIFAHSGTMGVASKCKGELGRYLSIEAQSLLRATSLAGGIATLYATDSRIIVDAPPFLISFALMQCDDPTQIYSGFWMGSGKPAEIQYDQMRELIYWCKTASQINQGAQVYVEMGKKDTLAYRIEGHEIKMDGTIEVNGKIAASRFFCMSIAQSLGLMRKTEAIEVTPVSMRKEGIDFWYIDGLDRHMAFCAAEARTIERDEVKS